MSEYQSDQHVDFNLDLVESARGHDDERKPFAFVVNGHRFTLADPQRLDWKELLEIDDPVMFFRYCMPEEQKELFKKQDISGEGLGKIIEAFQKHFDLGKRGNGRASRI